ncbi:MAG TPA: hypothetical protein VMB78_06015, partial [Dissulfurispiraceae bacterium]|nr:hypothetical protein [Dissulfurispiraceae bacterium]
MLEMFKLGGDIVMNVLQVFVHSLVTMLVFNALAKDEKSGNVVAFCLNFRVSIIYPGVKLAVFFAGPLPADCNMF